MEKKGKVLVATILAIGFAMSGYFVYQGISKYADKDRCVTVKGLSEREVLANHVTWPMSITLEGDNVNALLVDLKVKKDSLLSYLKENQINEKEITVSCPDITDRSEYDELKKGQKRYTVSVNVTVNTDKVQKVLELKKEQADLMAKGVRLSSYDYSTEYEYNDLSDLKPAMVEEATKNARKVAEKFAQDASCELGSIRNATQGQFTVEEQYYRPQYKQIRVVTTISYYLK